MKGQNTMDIKRNEEYSARLRFGYVSDYDMIKHMARVTFPELDDLVSGWLPVIVEHTQRDYLLDGKEHVCHYTGGLVKHHDDTYMKVGEHVACLMQGNGTESGVILGCFYDDKVMP